MDKQKSNSGLPDFVENFPMGNVNTPQWLPTKPKELSIKHTMLGDCSITPIKWAVKGLIPADGVTAIYGASGSGKTFLAAHLALCVATGKDFLSRRVISGKVVYIAAENPKSLQNRLAIMRDHDTLFKDYQFKGDEVSIFHGDIDLFKKSYEALQIIKLNLGKAIDEVALIVIDTLSAAFGGIDENSNDMATVVRVANEMQRGFNSPVVIIHHTGKDTGKGLRGHSSLRGNIDQSIFVDDNNQGMTRTLHVEKVKDLKTGEEISFDLLQIFTGIVDADHEELTGCIVNISGFGKDAPPKFKARGVLSSHGTTALKALENAIKDSKVYANLIQRNVFDEYLERYFNHVEKKHRSTYITRGVLNLTNKNYVRPNAKGDYEIL